MINLADTLLLRGHVTSAEYDPVCHTSLNDKTRAVLLAILGGICAGVARTVDQTMGWLNVHVGESPWVHRADRYHQRAVHYARRHAERDERGTMTNRPVRHNPPTFPAIGCTIRVTDQGTVTVQRDHGCTQDNIRELCAALVRGELEIVDLTGSVS